MPPTPPPSGAAGSSGPERDRQMARQVRHGWRHATDAGQVVQQWLRGPDGKRLRRNAKVMGVLREVLTEHELDKVEPVSIRQGVLTLGVSDNVLLSELRNHRVGILVAALVAGGTGIGRVVFRLKRHAAGR